MRLYRIASLKDLLNEFEEKDVFKRLSRFVCTRDPDREAFLHNKAIAFEKKNMARTYLAIIDDRSLDISHSPSDVSMSPTTKVYRGPWARR